MAGLLDNKDALMQGLLGLGGGLLSSSTGHYGQFGPAAGAGIKGFANNYFGALQQQKDNDERAKRLAMLEQMQKAQIGGIESENQKRQFEMDKEARLQALRARILGGAMPPQAGPQQSPQGLGGQMGGTVLPRPAAAAEGDLLASQVRQPAQNPPLEAPIEVTSKPLSFLQNTDALRATAMQLVQAELYNDAKQYMEMADRVEAQQNKENGKTDETYQDPDGIVRWKFGAQAGLPLPNQQKKAPEGFQWGDDGRLAPIPEYWEQKKGVAKAGATNITTKNILSAEKHYGEKFAGKIADLDSAMLEAANKAPDLADRANGIRQVVSTGKVITGTGADYRLALGKALNLTGMGGDAETIANTEALMVDLSRNTLDAIKASGLGSGSGFSNADRDFLEKAAGGKITLEAATIDRLATLAHRAALKSADKWNKRVKMIPRSALEGTGITRDPITVAPLFVKGRPIVPKGWTVEEVR